MAGAAVPDAGEVTTCPICGQEVMKKTMIPVLEPGTDPAARPTYRCVACARKLVVVRPGS